MGLLEQVFAAGVVGCGGAGFPTHAKLSATVDTLLLNGAECEPLLRTDRYLMIHKAKEILTAAEKCQQQVGATRCVLLLKASYTAEIGALEAAIAETKSTVMLHKSESFYPAGDEQVIVCEVTGRIVPPGGIPLDVGCVVSNVATMLAVYDAIDGTPFTHKYMTVTGEVNHPIILHLPVGTPLTQCIAAAGGTALADYSVVLGGPMMGMVITKEQAQTEVVTKTTSGIIVLSQDSRLAALNTVPLAHTVRRASSACIQCNFCSQLCPRNLMGHPLEPHRIMRKLAVAGSLTEILDDPDVQNALLCCECGICELYACPMQLQPRRVNAELKKLLSAKGIRLPKAASPAQVDENREYRKIPTGRAAIRAGVGDYYKIQIDELCEVAPDRVEIPVRQHIGAPAQPVVAVGDSVTVGTLIAACPEGKLGANIHASLAGTVVAVGERIVIERGCGA